MYKITKIFSYVLFYKFYSFKSYIYVTHLHLIFIFMFLNFKKIIYFLTEG